MFKIVEKLVSKLNVYLYLIFCIRYIILCHIILFYTFLLGAIQHKFPTTTKAGIIEIISPWMAQSETRIKRYTFSVILFTLL